MGSLTRTLMNSEVAMIINRSDLTSEINTRLQWAYDIVAGKYPWQVLETTDTSVKLVAGTYSYTVPTTLRGIRQARYMLTTSSAFLEYKDVDDFDDEHSYLLSTSQGAPTEWTRRGANIEIWPVPSTGQTNLVVGTDDNNYHCILSHTASSLNKPITGPVYSGYWASDSSSETASTWATGTSYVCSLLYLTGTTWPTAFTGDSSCSDLNVPLDQAIIYLAASQCYELMMEDQSAQYWTQKAEEIIQEAIVAEERFTPSYLTAQE